VSTLLGISQPGREAGDAIAGQVIRPVEEHRQLVPMRLQGPLDAGAVVVMVVGNETVGPVVLRRK
jgi:hypothetical protein